jgi:hypothetical protein
MPKIESRMRKDIAVFLPMAMQAAIMSYQNFLEEEATSDEPRNAKSFKEQHDACKIAIAHIDLLIKLAKWADIPPPELQDASQQKIMQTMIENAQAELNG